MYTISEAYPLTIDRTRTLEQLIAAGHYDWVDHAVTAEHFPPERGDHSKESALLVDFNRTMSTDAVLAELDRMNLRPGDLPELCAFGEQHPRIQRMFLIVELSSVWARRVGYRCVAYLWGGADGRHLRLRDVAGGWGDGYRFLAFRKS